MIIGDQLLSLLSGAKGSVRIAAPFIKVHALERVLLAIPDGVDVTCIARMRPEDVASGVCDLEVFDCLFDRRGATLLIHPQLHAKFFATDTTCLVGSANLSQTALGWRTPSNVELLIKLKTTEHGLEEWWTQLLAESIEATEELRDAIKDEAVMLVESGKLITRPEIEQDSIENPPVWVPECPRWTGLWEVYSGDEEQLPSSALVSAKSDLAALGLPPGLNEHGFLKAMRTSFRHTQIFHQLDQLSQQGLSDLAGSQLMIDVCGVERRDAGRRWQLLKNWLSGLYPNEFRIEAGQEVLLKGKSF